MATTLFGPRGIGIAIPVMVFLIVVFGEVLPMTIAVGMPHRFGLLVARPVLALQWLLTPVRLLLGAFTRLVSQAADGEGVAKAAITEAELRTLVEVGHQEGVVQRKEREMIHGVFELGETTRGRGHGPADGRLRHRRGDAARPAAARHPGEPAPPRPRLRGEPRPRARASSS